MKIALAQINPTVGDFTGNLEKIIAVTRRAAEQGARLAVFSELAICGYPPADFLEKPSFLDRCRQAVDELAAATRDLPTALVAGVALPAPPNAGKPGVPATGPRRWGGSPLSTPRFFSIGLDPARTAQAPLAVLRRLRRAALLSCPRAANKSLNSTDVRLAISICEDAWNDKNFWPRRLYSFDPLEELMRQNPAIHINLSSSPFWHSKREVRRQMLAAIAHRDRIPVVMCNQVGGNDSLIFDGSSLALNAQGDLIAQAKSFEEDLVLFDPFHAATDLQSCR